MEVQINGQSMAVTLEQLSGLDLSGVEAYRGSRLPVGVYEWRVKETKLDTGEFTDWETQEKVERPFIGFIFEVITPHSVSDKDIVMADLVGAEHRERFIIRDVTKDVGRFVALLQDTGIQWAGRLPDAIAAFHGHTFIAPIKHRQDRNDKDKFYANLDFEKVVCSQGFQPVVPGAVSPAAIAPAAASAPLAGVPGAAPAPATPQPEAQQAAPAPGIHIAGQ